MKIVKQSWQFEEPVDGQAILLKIERASAKAHPQMKALAEDMLKGFRTAVPVLFDDIHPEIM